MDLAKTKNIFLKLMVGCLVAAAAVAVVTVLTGKFNDILEKSLFTILIVAVHALISFGFISNNEKQGTFKNLALFTNATFGIIVLSFVTAIFGIWRIIPGDIFGKLYELYFVLLFAILHGEVLYKTLGEQQLTDRVIYANFFFMFIVVVLFIPAIFTSFDNTLSSLYYRFMAAMGIIDATLTILTVILHRIYLQRYPRALDATTAVPQIATQGSLPTPVSTPAHSHGALNVVIYVLAGLMALQFAAGIIFFVAIAAWNH
jgi:hypothetical protein